MSGGEAERLARKILEDHMAVTKEADLNKIRYRQVYAAEKSAQAAKDNANTYTKETIKAFLKNFMPYIALFTVFIVIVILMKKGSKSPVPSSKLNIKKDLGFFKNYLKSFNKFFSLGPSFKKFARILSPTSGDIQSNGRPVLTSGRSDNVTWVETDGDGNLTADGEMGYCETTRSPDNIYWKMDSTRMPEYAFLPKSVKDNIKNQMDIIIPWDINEEASFFVPQCEKAVYAYNCNPNDLSKCTRADLLEDNGMSCRLKEQTSLSYKGGKRCNNADDVGIINPKNARIMTLIKRLQNKFDKDNNSSDILVDYNEYPGDHAITDIMYNKDIPQSYYTQMVAAKNSPDFNAGTLNAANRAYTSWKMQEDAAATAATASSDSTAASPASTAQSAPAAQAAPAAPAAAPAAQAAPAAPKAPLTIAQAIQRALHKT